MLNEVDKKYVFDLVKQAVNDTIIAEVQNYAEPMVSSAFEREYMQQITGQQPLPHDIFRAYIRSHTGLTNGEIVPFQYDALAKQGGGDPEVVNLTAMDGKVGDIATFLEKQNGGDMSVNFPSDYATYQQIFDMSVQIDTLIALQEGTYLATEAECDEYFGI